MGTLMAFEWMSADGVFDASSMGEWWEPYDSLSRQECIKQTYADVDAFLMGRTTFELLEPFWSQLPDEAMGGVAGILTHTPKYVVSTSLAHCSWGPVSSVSLKDGGAVEELKRRHSRVALIGSARVAETLSQQGLIDEFRFLVQPRIMGSGERFFRRNTSTSLELMNSATLDRGVLVVDYRRVF